MAYEAKSFLETESEWIDICRDERVWRGWGSRWRSADAVARRVSPRTM
jgi:hypothetical protein